MLVASCGGTTSRDADDEVAGAADGDEARADDRSERPTSCRPRSDLRCDGDALVRASDGAVVLRCGEQSPAMACVEPGFCAQPEQPGLRTGVDLGAALMAAPLSDDLVAIGWAGEDSVEVGVLRPALSEYGAIFALDGLDWVSQLALAVGGSPDARRIHVAWVAGGKLWRAVLGAGGEPIAEPAPVADAWSTERVGLSGTLDGAVISYIRADGDAVSDEAGPFPHLLRLDADGAVVSDQPIDASIWKSYDVTSLALPDGHLAAVWVEYRNDPDRTDRVQAIQLARYAPDGERLDAAPAAVMPPPLASYLSPGGGHVPITALPGSEGTELIFRVPDRRGQDQPLERRLARTSATAAEPVTLGPFMRDLAPCLSRDEALTLLGDGNLALVVGQREERSDDPHALLSKSDLLGAIVDLDAPGQPVQGPLPLSTWDPTPGLEGPSGPGPYRVVASPSVPGQVTVVWRDGELRARSYRFGLP